VIILLLFRRWIIG